MKVKSVLMTIVLSISLLTVPVVSAAAVDKYGVPVHRINVERATLQWNNFLENDGMFLGGFYDNYGITGLEYTHLNSRTGVYEEKQTVWYKMESEQDELLPGWTSIIYLSDRHEIDGSIAFFREEGSNVVDMYEPGTSMF